MLRRLFRLGRRGAVASEFAIVAIFMTGLGFLSLEVVYAMVARGVVESGLERASRLAATGLGGPAMPGRLATFNTTYSNMVSGMIDYSGTITNTLAAYERIDWVMNPPVGFTPATDLGQSQWYVVYEFDATSISCSPAPCSATSSLRWAATAGCAWTCA